jgi:hypothetical protein
MIAWSGTRANQTLPNGRLNAPRSPKQPSKELRDRDCGTQQNQPVPDTPPLVRIRKERSSGPLGIVEAIARLEISRWPAIDVLGIPSGWRLLIY